MPVFAGIDGGQSSTVAVIGDETGRIVGRGSAGPADELGVGAESTRLQDALLGALRDASRHARIAQSATFDAIVAGVSGYNGRVYGRAPQMPSDRFVLMHDAPIAHAGALAGKDGVVIIAGTGSVVYGVDSSGSSHLFGGWGFLFGDEGSAFRIAADALTTMMRAEDDGDASFADDTRLACEYFGMPSLRWLGRAFYSRDVTRHRLASFAPHVLGSQRLAPAAYRGADRLGELAANAIRCRIAARVALSGGLFDNAAFRERVCQAIRARVEPVEIVPSRYEPAEGALLLAYRERGTAIDELTE